MKATSHLRPLVKLTLLTTLITCGALAQTYQGSFTYDTNSTVNTILIQMQISGSRVTGNLGLAYAGQTPVANMAFSGTYSNGTCSISVTTPTSMALTGACNGSNFSSTYRSSFGTGKFSASVRPAAAPAPAPTPAPTKPPAPTPAPVPTPQSATTACTGTMTFSQSPTYHAALAASLQVSGGRIAGYFGTAAPGVTPAATAAASGSYSGSSFTISVNGGYTFTGTLSTNGFSGNVALSSTNGPQSGVFSLGCGGAAAPPAPPLPAPAPTPAPITKPPAPTVPAPAPAPPQSANSLSCNGTVVQSPNYRASLSAGLQFSAGRISGSFIWNGNGYTTATGSYSGSSFTITDSSGNAFSGSFSSTALSGTVKMAGSGMQPGAFSLGCGGAAAPPLPVVSTPAPAPSPAPAPVSTTPKAPAQYCGIFTGPDYAGKQYVNAPFVGTFTSFSPIGAQFELLGVNAAWTGVTGTLSGTTCQGSYQGFSFSGTCDSNSLRLNYSYAQSGKAGTIIATANTAGCPYAPPGTPVTSPSPAPAPTPSPTPAPIAAPAPSPSPSPSPASASMGCAGTMVYTSLPYQSSATFTANLQFNGGKVSGAIGIGQPGQAAPPPAAAIASGTYTGASFSFTVQHGPTYTGSCTSTSCSGSFTVPTASGAETGAFSLGCNGGSAPPTPTPAPQPQPQPQPTPQPQPALPQTLSCQGSQEQASTRIQRPISVGLQLNGGRITGSLNFGSGTTSPVTGSYSGSACTFAPQGIEAGTTYSGTCTAAGFSGVFLGPTRSADDSGPFSLGCGGAPAPVMPSSPVSTPNPIATPAPPPQQPITIVPVSPPPAATPSGPAAPGGSGSGGGGGSSASGGGGGGAGSSGAPPNGSGSAGGKTPTTTPVSGGTTPPSAPQACLVGNINRFGSTASVQIKLSGAGGLQVTGTYVAGPSSSPALQGLGGNSFTVNDTTCSGTLGGKAFSASPGCAAQINGKFQDGSGSLTLQGGPC